jgi:hypothetical protein
MKNLIITSVIGILIFIVIGLASILKNISESYDYNMLVYCRTGYLGAISKYWDKSGENPDTVLKIANKFCVDSMPFIKERLQNQK